MTSIDISYTLNNNSANESCLQLFKRGHILPFLHLFFHKLAFALFFLDFVGILTLSLCHAFFNDITHSIINLIIYLPLLVFLICDFECFTVEALFGKYFCLPQFDITEIEGIILIIQLLLILFNHNLVVYYNNSWQGIQLLDYLDLIKLSQVLNTLFQIGSLGVCVGTDQDLTLKLICSER